MKAPTTRWGACVIPAVFEISFRVFTLHEHSHAGDPLALDMTVCHLAVPICNLNEWPKQKETSNVQHSKLRMSWGRARRDVYDHGISGEGSLFVVESYGVNIFDVWKFCSSGYFLDNVHQS